MYKLSIIIPLFNEQHRLSYNLTILEKFLKKKSKKDIEIIFVNDGSYDSTNEIIKNFIHKNKKNCKFRYISYKNNIGKGFAVKKGILASKNYWILVCDADMSVSPKQFDIWFKNNLIQKKDEAYFGSRVHKQSNIKALFVRKIIGFLFNILLSLLFNIKSSDTQCGFKVFNSHYIKKIFRKLKCNGYAYDVEIALLLNKHHIKIIELPLKWKHQKGSKVNLIKDSIKIFFDLIILKVR